jgi:hypothetical protein
MNKPERGLLFFGQLHRFLEREIRGVAAIDRHKDVFVHHQPPRNDYLSAWIAHSLRKGDELIRFKLHCAVELFVIDRSPEYGRETFGSAK